MNAVVSWEDRAAEFFHEAWDTLQGCLPTFNREPVIFLGEGRRRDSFEVSIPLAFQGKQEQPSDLYSVNIQIGLCESRDGNAIAVHSSQYALRIGTAAIVRFEYDRDRSGAHPAAHAHVHGAGTWLSPALMKNRPGSSRKAREHARKGEIEVLHFPMGGHRFRPSMEDFLFFVIGECGFHGVKGWEKRLLATREGWLDIQLAAAVGDKPEIAAEKLRCLGYRVAEPPGGPLPCRRYPGW